MEVSRRGMLAGGAVGLGILAAATTVQPASGVAVSEATSVDFDSYFAPGGPGNPGGTDGSDPGKFAALDAWLAARNGATGRPKVRFGARNYQFTSLGLWAGMDLEGVKPAREYKTGTVFTCSQPNAFRWVQNTGYSYPSQGAPRDINIANIYFVMGQGKNWIEPATTYTTARVLWMSTVRGCGWTGPQTIMDCYQDGVSVFDAFHVQGAYDTPWRWRGSECLIGGAGHSFMDGDKAYAMNVSGKPFMELALSVSTVADVMISSRGAAYALLINGGDRLTLRGVAFDASDTDPTYGSAVKIVKGSAIGFDHCSWKGMMTNPGAAAGLNRGWCDISGGSEITFLGNHYRRAGNNVPATTVPLVYAEADVLGVKFGLNSLSGFGTAKGVLRQAAAGVITANLDPSVTVQTG